MKNYANELHARMSRFERRMWNELVEIQNEYRSGEEESLNLYRSAMCSLRKCLSAKQGSTKMSISISESQSKLPFVKYFSSLCLSLQTAICIIISPHNVILQIVSLEAFVAGCVRVWGGGGDVTYSTSDDNEYS